MLVAVTWFALPAPALAQEIEPRLYSNAPVGVNFLVAGFTNTQGGLASDPSLPFTKPDLQTNSAVLGFARALDLWGTSGRIELLAPFTWLSGTALDDAGQQQSRSVSGFADPAVRLSVNLYGAPALTIQQFQGWKQDLVVGAALTVSPPLGQYDETRLVNIGSNRWWFKPSLGVSQALGPWTLEATAAGAFFTDNDEFFGGRTRAQDPVYSGQAHVIRAFGRGIWASISATYFTGGSTEIDGVPKRDLQRNWRVGATFAMPVSRLHSVKLYASDGVSARTGNSFVLYGIAWQYRWGGGL